MKLLACCLVFSAALLARTQSQTQALPTQDPPPPPFPEWVATLRTEALGKGIRAETFDKAFENVAPDPVVLARDRTQPEATQSLEDYVAARMTPKILASAKAALDEQAVVLEKVHSAYGVPAPVMVAFWGVESNFGQFLGTRPVIVSLATLAYDSRRTALFRTELIEALRILDKGLVALPDFKGSWAGALGQPQFLPSSFLRHAVDFDGDGKPDIWTSKPDVFASMANYLKHSGWTDGERWGREVKVTPEVLAAIERQVPYRTTGCRARKEMTAARPLKEWAVLGVRLVDGDFLPEAPLSASLVRGTKRRFLVYHNYEAILDYNCSNSYGISVGLLSDAVTPAAK